MVVVRCFFRGGSGSDVELQVAVGSGSVLLCGLGKLGLEHVRTAANVE